MAQDTFPTLVYIYGSGHSGSTLLNQLLNAHDDVIGMNELDRIHEARRNGAYNHVFDTEYWRRVQRAYEQRSGNSLTEISLEVFNRGHVHDVSATRFVKWAKDNQDLIQCIAQEAGVNFVVDASKRDTRLNMLAHTDMKPNIKVIQLLRDGRAVLNSHIRKEAWHSGKRPFLFGLKSWVRPLMMSVRLRRKYGRENWLIVRYEQLSKDPESTLKSICDFLDISYSSDMVSHYNYVTNYSVLGNYNTLKNPRPIKLDERWRDELAVKPRLLFNLSFGWLNWLLGYR
jgi:hypothetical protein